MNKQEFLESIVGYLPYGLDCEIINEKHEDKQIGKAMGIYNDGSIVFENIIESDKGFDEVKPILRQLKSFTDKELIDFGFSFLPKTFPDPKEVGIYSYEFVKYCYKNHYDIHDLIGQGWAVEKK